MGEQQWILEDSSVLWDTEVAGTSLCGYTICLPDTPNMTVHLDAAAHRQKK